jgi:hypothetical protein
MGGIRESRTVKKGKNEEHGSKHRTPNVDQLQSMSARDFAQCGDLPSLWRETENGAERDRGSSGYHHRPDHRRVSVQNDRGLKGKK